jgi:hypothetical protein
MATAVRVEVAYGTSPSRLAGRSVDATQGGRHTLRLAGLRPSTTYFYRATVRGPDGRATVSPVRSLTTTATDVTAPALSGVEVTPLPDGTAGVAWRSGEATRATLLVGSRPDALRAVPGYGLRTDHTVVVTGLRPSATYHYRVRGVDATGNATVWPPLSQPPARFVSAATGVADHTRVAGAWTSRVLDAGQMVTWDRLTYRAELPASGCLRISVRTGGTAQPDATWSGWTPVDQGGRVEASSRYIQYRVEADRGCSPVLRGVGITSNAPPPVPIHEAAPPR